MTKLEYATKLAKMGFKVFPLRENDKRPLLKGNAQTQGTTDLNQVRDIWTQYPKANIGIATGDGLTVIDVDTIASHGVDGESSMINYQVENGFINETLEVTTPTGGKHYYYLTDNEYSNKASILPGVDVRGLGGYVVGPGSTINGTLYEAKQLTEPQRANSEVLQLLGACKKRETSTDPFEALEKGYSETLIPQGSRTDYLIKQCAQLCDGTKTLETMKKMIQVINENNLEIPLTDKELEMEVFPSLERFKKHEAKKVDPETSIDPNKITLVSVSDIEKEYVEWLVPGYIPKGTITIIGGDGGLGKTSLWCNIASAISNGKPCVLQDNNDVLYPRGEVIYFSGEDDTARVLKDRLEQNGANLDNISTLQMDDDAFTSLSIGGALIEDIIEARRPMLVIFDPIQQFIKNADMSKRNDMRQTMTSLSKLGKRYGTTFILVMHTNKRDKIGSFRDKLSDSADLWDISRSVLALGRNQNGENFITHEKSNYGIRQNAILYHIENGRIIRDSFEKERMTYVELMGGKSKADKTDMRLQCKNVYLDLLSREKQSVKKDLEDRLQPMGYSKNMIRQVYNDLIQEQRIEATKTSGGKGQGIRTILTLKQPEET